jgi:hypothetical protein
MADRSMAIKHAKAKKEAMKEIMANSNNLAQTSWGTTPKQKANFARPAYSFPNIKEFL